MASNYKEIRGKLGLFGKVWRVFLVGWQILMLAWWFSYTSEVAPLVENASTDLERGATGFGIAIVWSMIAFFWVGGTVVLGIFVLMTRQTKMLEKRYE